jgi:MFS family permease
MVFSQPTFQQLISSLLTLGSFISSLLAGFFASYFGRKQAIWLACVLNGIAAAILIATTNWGAVYFGRLLLGIANGFLVTFSNVYTSEASPAHLRGVLVALFAYWVNIGSILGSTVNNFTKRRLDKSSYQIPLGCLYIVPAILAVGLFFVPESPRFLLHKGKEAEAKRALIQLRGSALTKDELEFEWAEMIRGMEEEKRNAKSVGWIDMFRGIQFFLSGMHWICLLTHIIRYGPSPNSSVLWHDRLSKRFRNLVFDRLSNILPATRWCD